MVMSMKDSQALADMLNEDWKNHRRTGANQDVATMFGWITRNKNNPVQRNIPSEDRSQWSLEKWQFLLTAPFNISHKCCQVMKKDPIHRYEKEAGKAGMTAQMTDESLLRQQKWLQNGCNAFNAKRPISNPMSFWTEQDVLQYIYERKLPICSVYGEVIQSDNQLTLADVGIDMGDFRPCYETTGCNRTGCMLCGFGAHLEKESRFQRLHKTHPKMYALLDKMTNNGYTMRQAIEWVNEHGNLNIRL